MAKKKYTPGWGRIAAKLQRMLKDKIRQYDLIDTELMIDTIYVTYENDSLVVNAQSYFKFLDEGTVNIPAYNIIQDCINSKEFQTYIKNVMVEEIEYDLKDIE